MWTGCGLCDFLWWVVACCLCPVVGLIIWISLVTRSRDVGRVCFPFCRGVQVQLVGLLIGLFVGSSFGCLSYARCVGLFVIDFVSE